MPFCLDPRQRFAVGHNECARKGYRAAEGQPAVNYGGNGSDVVGNQHQARIASSREYLVIKRLPQLALTPVRYVLDLAGRTSKPDTLHNRDREVGIKQEALHP